MREFIEREEEHVAWYMREASDLLAGAVWLFVAGVILVVL